MPIKPLQAADDVFARADRLMKAASSLRDPMLVDDMRRAAIAFGVAALDTYLHWAIADVPLHGKIPTALGRLEVPFSEMLELSEAVVENRKKIRPKVRSRNTLERVILQHTFQSPRGVENAMLLLGKRNAFVKIADEIQPHQAPKDIQDRLGTIAGRRNQVVHEGDLQRQSRPQNIKREPVDLKQVKDDLLWLRSLVTAIDSVLGT